MPNRVPAVLLIIEIKNVNIIIIVDVYSTKKDHSQWSFFDSGSFREKINLNIVIMMYII